MASVNLRPTSGKSQTSVSSSTTTTSNGVLSAGVYSLKWNAFELHLTSGLGKLLEDDEYTDVTLACDGQFIKAHKFLLSLCSPFFKRLFKANKVESNGSTIVILNNIPFQDLENILRFIYNGETNVSNEDLESFLHTGEVLQIEGLSSSSNGEKIGNPDLRGNKCTTLPTRKTGMGSSSSSLITDGNTASTNINDTSLLQNQLLRPSNPTSRENNNDSGRTSHSPEYLSSNNIPSPLQQHSPKSNHSSLNSTHGNRSQGVSPANMPRTLMSFDDQLSAKMSPSTIIEEVDPLQFHETEITEVRERNRSFENEDRYEQYNSCEVNESHSNNSNLDEDEDYYMDTCQDQLIKSLYEREMQAGANGREELQRSGIPLFRTRPYLAPERKKTSALWIYFKYDEEMDLVRCQLMKDGRNCTFNARHKPLSNMKYHIRTSHPEDYEIILPRLLNRR